MCFLWAVPSRYFNTIFIHDFTLHVTIPKADRNPQVTSDMELFVTIVKGWKALTIVTKNFNV